MTPSRQADVRRRRQPTPLHPVPLAWPLDSERVGPGRALTRNRADIKTVDPIDGKLTVPRASSTGGGGGGAVAASPANRSLAVASSAGALVDRKTAARQRVEEDFSSAGRLCRFVGANRFDMRQSFCSTPDAAGCGFDRKSFGGGDVMPSLLVSFRADRMFSRITWR
jgi:hypothetical protein